MIPHSSRRAFLMTGSALFGSAFIPHMASATGARDPRLIVLVLHGALDGLAAVGPVGDPDYAALHGPLAMERGGAHPGLPLDGFFMLNPGMPNFARMYRGKTATVVHATATNYRERSHFDGQDVLESGMAGPGFTESGWLNRAVAAVPARERVGRAGGLAIGAATPIILRGSAPVLGWAPETIPTAGDDLARRVLDLYAQTDPLLKVAMRQGLDVDRIAKNDAAGLPGDNKPKGGPGSPAGMKQAAEGAARLLAANDGPRVAALVFDGWDSHAGEGGATGKLMQQLGGLDDAFAAFETGLGPAWRDTVVVAITEFGRTARVNGTVGTDHGTGTVAFLAGGALKGGRVIADWPGLKPAQLYEARDLKPTTDLRAVLKGVLADQLGLSPAVLGTAVFPRHPRSTTDAGPYRLSHGAAGGAASMAQACSSLVVSRENETGHAARRDRPRATRSSPSSKASLTASCCSAWMARSTGRTPPRSTCTAPRSCPTSAATRPATSGASSSASATAMSSNRRNTRPRVPSPARSFATSSSKCTAATAVRAALTAYAVSCSATGAGSRTCAR